MFSVLRKYTVSNFSQKHIKYIITHFIFNKYRILIEQLLLDEIYVMQ